MSERFNGPFNLRNVARSLSLKRKGNNSAQGNQARNVPPTASNLPVQTSTPPLDIAEEPLAALGYSSLNYIPPPDNRPRRTKTATHRRAQQSYDLLGSTNANGKLQNRAAQLPLRASRSDESLAVEAAEPPKLQSTARGAPSGPPAYGSPLPTTSPYIVKSPKLDADQNGASVEYDYLQNVKDHMRANADLIGNGPFFSVQRGWKKGIYTSRAEADKQIRNFPGPIIKTFENLDEAITFLKSDLLANEPKDEDQDEEVLERARIFSDLAKSGHGELKRAISLSSERRNARIRAASPRQKGNLEPSPPSSAELQIPPGSASAGLQPLFPPAATSPFAAHADDPLEKLRPLEPIAGPSRVVALLPVRSLANSKAFYVDVLGLRCTSQHQSVQAVLMSSSGAAICLRSLEVAPLAPTGTALARSGSLQRSGSSNSVHTRTSLPSMNEDGEPVAPTTDQALEVSSQAESRQLRSPVPPPPPPRSATLSMSGITALVEHRGPLDALHAAVSQRVAVWLQDGRRTCESRFGSRRMEGVKMLSGIEDKPWGSQEFHVSDPDGHRLIFTSPLDPSLLTVSPGSKQGQQP
ncbi:hypothetical protein ACQY0O_006835 [Thecaphora frezii]